MNPIKVNRFHRLRYKLAACLRCSPALFLAIAATLPGVSEARPGDATAPGSTSHDQESAGNPRVRLERVLALCGAGAAIHYLGFRYFDRAWYQGEKRDSIRWINDWSGDTYLNLDKGGHFMGGLFLSSLFSSAYSWAGFGTRTSTVLGTLTSWGALFEIEMRDAYFVHWGFSIPDFFFNTLGGTVPIVYATFPPARAFGFKFSYWPSPLYLERVQRSREGRPHTDHLIDDYQGMTFWMTVAIEKFLHDRGARIWPDFLGLALGYSGIGLHGSNVKSKGPFREYEDLPDGQPEFLIALDFDVRYLPGDGAWWKSLKSQLNWIHLPAPAVRVYPDLRFYVIRR